MTNVSDSVSASLTRYNMLLPGDRIGVAVSAGADSVALLHILHGLAAAPGKQFELMVLHVNHQLRATESAADEEFVRALAQQLDLPVEVLQSPPGTGNMEQNARDARRAFFQEVRQRCRLHRVALGHNRSDQAETVLYRFIRGSGLAGLSGMRPVTADGLIRPLLAVTREEIREWAAAQGIAWREDSSNLNRVLVRNRLRWEEINPRLVQVLSTNATVAQDEEAWWTRRMDELYTVLVTKTDFGLQLGVPELNRSHPAEQRRLIRRVVQEVKGDLRSIDVSHIEAVRRLIEVEAGHDRLLIPGVDLLRSFGTLLLAKPGKLASLPRHFSLPVEFGKELALPHGGGSLYVNWIKLEDRFCGNFGMEADLDQEVADLDGDILAGVGRLDGLQIRNWEPGDEYRRVGHSKSEKIKSFFQEYRVVLWHRRRWPVLVLENEIVWSRQFGTAARFQAQEASRSVLRLMYS